MIWLIVYAQPITIDYMRTTKIRFNRKYASVDKSKVAGAGQSCGGLEVYKVGVDKRITTIGIMNSGKFSESATAQTARTVTKPIFYFLGGPDDIAYKNVSFLMIKSCQKIG
jgi:hypothetical protein